MVQIIFKKITNFGLTTHRMIIVKLHGGLGKQLFQDAFGRAFAHLLGTELQLDVFLLAKFTLF
ncbi:MAG: hypothetical protein EAZ70_00810 [Runella slithyformis]|nr:MAG: hypothetical protein EAY79_01205 [Runella slithyformis]TAF97276.1 MAG: hypothetical protein EAZ46_02665 [Runella sp.]TAG21817.1 MAG: hypothetical protein EAZ38_07200 [Cytophagales bacterium]TAG41019.1 MAG: hypothetical protein EAZ32_04315 [Cytophagia bacterium]TAE94197.1 MAG: hypothetical protein EAZ80_10610 [Runella slithyformis]